MTESQDELWRDVSVVLKHIRFIVALFALAIVVAVASGLAASSESRAISEAEIVIEASTPLFGGTDTVPTLDTFDALAQSDEVVQTAAQEIGVDPEELRKNITVRAVERDPRDRESVDRLSIEATGASRGQARETAAAVMDAFVAAAEGSQSDPQGLESLQEQETLALQRLQEFDQAEVLELVQVQADLARNRSLIASLKGQVTAIEQALELIRAEGSRPLAELVVAISGVLGGSQGTGGIDQASTVEELEQGLELRRQLDEGLTTRAEQEVETLAQRERELLLVTAEGGAAMALYTTAVRNLRAAELAESLTETEITVTERGLDSSSGVNWLARLAAAAAFGLVVGVVGAFALELLGPYWRRWREGNTASPSREP
jgi:hypothetical protein